jgi:hypothetical protein
LYLPQFPSSSFLSLRNTQSSRQRLPSRYIFMTETLLHWRLNRVLLKTHLIVRNHSWKETLEVHG